MRILWTVNTFNKNISSIMGVHSAHSISWVEAMSDYFKNYAGVTLAIAAPATLNAVRKDKIDGVLYYAVPSNRESWLSVIKDFQPEIIHEYGTEKSHNMIVCEVAENIPIIVSLQGILSEYQRHYYGGIDMSTILRYSPLRDWIRPSGFITGRKDFQMRSVKENILLKKVDYVEGRSTWDRVAALRINPKLKYYYCPRMLRRPFNESQAWDIKKCERHSILISQGNYPIKGVHFAFIAVASLKEKYPDIKLIITGNDMFKNMTGWHRFLCTGYMRFLFDLANNLGIMDNIHFTGTKEAEEMASLVRKAHVVVIPSAIENAPNTLAEAMMIGTPCIASYVGGNMDMLKHKEEGLLYCYNEPYMLAEYISQIFESDELAVFFSKNARKTAKLRHDPNSLTKQLWKIYYSVIREYRKENNV